MYKLDKAKFIYDISQELLDCLIKIAEKMKKAMQDEILQLPISGSHKSVGASEWREEVINAIDYAVDSTAIKTLNNVMVEVGLVNSQDDFNLMFKALLVNYGMGKTADFDENEWKYEYFLSKAYDISRQITGNRVYSRPDEVIYDIETDEWRESRAKTRYEIPRYWLEASYFFENGIRQVQGDIEMEVNTILDNIDIMKYIHKTK